MRIECLCGTYSHRLHLWTPNKPSHACAVKPEVLKSWSLRPLLLRISSAHAIHWSRACHVIFKRAHRVENLTKYRADDLCVNLVCEYFCWKLGDPRFFFGRSLPFLTLYIILKNQKNLCVGSCNYLSYTIKKGSNWYMETGVRDLEVVFFKAILADLMTYVAKIYQLGLYKPCQTLIA